jgi:hypothetical protein
VKFLVHILFINERNQYQYGNWKPASVVMEITSASGCVGKTSSLSCANSFVQIADLTGVEGRGETSILHNFPQNRTGPKPRNRSILLEPGGLVPVVGFEKSLAAVYEYRKLRDQSEDKFSWQERAVS